MIPEYVGHRHFHVKQNGDRMHAILDWQTKSLVVKEDTDQIQLFSTEEEATTYARAELQGGLWSVLEVPIDALPFIK